eukprot:4692648-Alexandrium_andersonii.AAC.1
MSASLVGSEMCIRDRSLTVLVIKDGLAGQCGASSPVQRALARGHCRPGGGEHPPARTPSAGSAEDRQRTGAGRLAPGCGRAAGRSDGP